MQTSAHPPVTGTRPARRAALTKPRRPRPAPFPHLPEPSHPRFWVVVLQQNQLSMDAVERAIDANANSARYVEALSHGLWAALRELRRDNVQAAQSLLLDGRILMAVPA